MFTGIIRELGRVKSIEKIGDTYRLEIESKSISKDINIGDSAAVNGVCLTLVKKNRDILSFDCVKETIRKTTLDGLKNNDSVNLEGSLRVGDSLGGHFVLGHIDCMGKVRSVGKRGEDASIGIEIPDEFRRLVVEKGSIAIDGISLTVGEAKDNNFKVYIIPHTLKVTTLGSKKRGDRVNIEFDVIGKYVINLEGLNRKTAITEEFLKNKGFD